MRHLGVTEQRWINLWARVGVNEERWVRAQYATLLNRYNVAHRAHHTFTHIQFGFKLLDEHRHLARNYNAVEMAWFFHNVIYQAQEWNFDSPSNELCSATFADSMMRRGCLTGAFRQKVCKLIQATTHQSEFVKTQDQRLIADIDWSVLGLPWREYLTHLARVRREYAKYSDKEFLVRRAAWITSNQKDKLFYLDEFNRLFNERAKENLRMEFGFYRGPDFAKLWELL